MKIILADIINKDEYIQTKYHPLGLGYLAVYLKEKIKKPLDIRVVVNKIKEEIDNFRPEIVGLSCVSEHFNKAKEIAKYAKKNGAVVIIGKSHISSLPLILDKSMDVGVIGEGEEIFVELINLFINKKFAPASLRDMRGIVFWENGKIVQTEKRSLINNLDSIPFPDREILNVRKGDSIYMFSSRGCPYRCRFCFSARFWDKVRFFSAEYVVDEIRYLYKKYRPLRITFCDDLFVADYDRLAKIVELIKKEPFYKKIKFTISVRANLINEKVAVLLKEMRVDIVNMGLESGNYRILKFLKGASVTVEDGVKAIKLLKRLKFQVSASFIIGSPDETREEIINTLDFIKKSKLDYFEVGLLTPLPGTPIWDYAKGRKLVSDIMDWSRLTFNFKDNFDKAIILSERLSRQELKELYRLFLREQKKRRFKLLLKYIYRRPREIIGFIKNKIIKNF